MAWEGMLQLYQNDGSPGDAWGSYDSPYMEDNWTMQASPEMNVREPCNYVSNLAYYRAIISICAHGDRFKMDPVPVQGLGNLDIIYDRLKLNLGWLS